MSNKDWVYFFFPKGELQECFSQKVPWFYLYFKILTLIAVWKIHCIGERSVKKLLF